ncbi:MAG: bacteriohemerythrin [Candidatus Nitrohelix vancouverensis]|uniref:Bacteriohemerythrin n=1 Tax=Candidatus Nitrohelix vancouverensis TaxID=2705534 RepID=A0A7T0C1L8_9BACT|nr:MAG: bacteriohemerythrin [Candidatus Nitrohelix vancouverensis]
MQYVTPKNDTQTRSTITINGWLFGLAGVMSAGMILMLLMPALSLSIAALFVIAGFVMASTIGGRLTNRLNRLIDRIEATANGDFSQVLHDARNDGLDRAHHALNQVDGTLSILCAFVEGLGNGGLPSVETVKGLQSPLGGKILRSKQTLDQMSLQMEALVEADLDNPVLNEPAGGALGARCYQLSQNLKSVGIAQNGTKGLQAERRKSWVDLVNTEEIERLRENNILLKSIIEQMPFNVMYADREFNLVYMNPASMDTLRTFENLLPDKVENLIGQSIDIFHKNAERNRKILSDPRNLPHTAEIQLGREALALNIYPLYGEGGQYLGPMVTWDKITEKMKMEAAQRKAEEEKREVVMQVTSIVRSLGLSSDELSTVSQNLSVDASVTAKLSGEVSGRAQEVSANIQSVAAGAEEMTASIKEIALSTEKATKVTEQAVQEAKKTSRSISELGDSSAEIGEVIKVINSIADQTNLLALNATIEAARATEDIRKRVEAIQCDSQQAVSSVSGIVSIVEEINDISNTIASAIEEQTATTNEMGRNIQEAAQGSLQIADNTQKVAQSANATNAGAQDTESASRQLSTMSSQLQDMVVGFGVDDFILWDDKYKVGVEVVDSQHKQLFDLINELYKAFNEGHAQERITKVMDGLVKYTGYHFREEEALMEQAGYPDLEAHKEKHRKLVAQVMNYQRQLNEGELDDGALLKFLKEWLSNHIMGVDKFYVSHMHRHGIR